MGRVAVAVIVSLWAIPISLMVNHIVPEPYMDEIFHIPQVQQYCKGNFRSWDPMITTPPGLYYLSLAHVASLFPGMWCAKAISSFSELCSSATLRSLNGVLAVICSLLVYDVLTYSKPALSERKATLIAVVLSLYPLHWFFTFLYYTDVASLTIVLAMHLACVKQHYHLSALLGALAILIRQTNIVWMVLVACTGAINLLLPQNYKDDVHSDDQNVTVKENDVVAHKDKLYGQNLRKRKTNKPSNASNHYASEMDASSQCHASASLLEEVQQILSRLWHLKREVLVSFGPFFLVLVGFITFVLWNGSIVLGAKEAHTVSPHFAQLMYFALVSASAMGPFHFSFRQASLLCQSFQKNKVLSFILVFIALTAGFFFVHFFSIAHPYLLADNRHYTFYIWRKVIKSHWLTKYLLVPLYVYSWLSIFSLLGEVIKLTHSVCYLVGSSQLKSFLLASPTAKAQRKIWVLVFFLACAAVLVPAPLIEFRYYTIPFYFLVLHSRVDDDRSWIFMGILYCAVNIFTIMMFLFRPFHWNHEPGTQRFIW